MSQKAKIVCAMAVVLRELNKRKKEERKQAKKKNKIEIKKKRLWVKESREDRYCGYDESESIPHTFKQVLGINDDAFNFLLEKIADKIHKADTVMRLAIPAKLKLQVFLEYIVTGCSITKLDGLFHVSSSSISKFIPEVADAILESLHDYLQTPADDNEWKAVADGFEERYGVENCVGALQGITITHKQWIRYSKDVAVYFWFVADTGLNLICVDVGTCLTDGCEFSQSILAQAMADKTIQLPDECYFVGPSNVPLETYLMTPFPGVGVECLMSDSEQAYNAKVDAISQTAESTFSLLRSRFQIFDNPVILAPENVAKLVLAACALHNWMQRSLVCEKKVDLSLQPGIADPCSSSATPGAGSITAPGIFTLLSGYTDNVNQEAVSRRYALVERFAKQGVQPGKRLTVETAS